MAAAERQLGRKVTEPGPKLPSAGRHVWQAFSELHSARSGSGFGPNPISYAEMEAWSRLTRWPLAYWEVTALRQLDEAYLTAQAKRPREGKTGDG